MDAQLEDRAIAVARAAVRCGGAELRKRYLSRDVAGDYQETDVKAAADTAAEAAMLPLVQQAFPDHTIYAEESGTITGTDRYRWIIDPLDGTNNFTAGLPTFSSAVALEVDDEPRLAAVLFPATGELYTASHDAGVTLDGDGLDPIDPRPPAVSTVAFVRGFQVVEDQAKTAQADSISRAIDGVTKRTIESWAPTVHACLFATGRIDGLVQYHPDLEEAAVIDLFAAESGADIIREEAMMIAAHHPELRDRLDTIVRNGDQDVVPSS